MISLMSWTRILPPLQQHYWPIVTISYLKQRQSLFLLSLRTADAFPVVAPTTGNAFAVRRLVSPDIKIFNFTLRNKHEIFKAFEELDQAKATGCDGISAKALKLAAPNISQSLTYLFNVSLRTSQFPSVWEIARVAPLFKAGSPTDCDNYRWVILLIIGLFRYCPVFRRSWSLTKFCTRRRSHTEQHKFAYYSKFSSTTVELLKVVDSWKFAIDDGLKSVCVYLDLRIAFDVKHDILLAKL